MSVVSDVQLVVLGSGTSSGVPVIGCSCETCHSPDPRDERLRTSACVRFRDPTGAERVILLDASPDLRLQALRTRMPRCDAIFFTHAHVDHTFGLDEVRRFNVVIGGPIDVYADDETIAYLRRVYEHIFAREQRRPSSFVATLVPRRIAPRHPVDLHGLRVTPIELLHGHLPVLGFRIDALDESGELARRQPAPLPLAWCTDVSGIPPASWELLGGLETLFLGMLRYRAHPTHFTVDEAIEAASRIEAASTWFVHMTHDIRHAELDPRLPARMRLAYDGLCVAARAAATAR